MKSQVLIILVMLLEYTFRGIAHENTLAPQNVNAIFPAPVFSMPHGFYSRSFQLVISNAGSDAAIYYTTDGSVPSVLSGKLYEGSITVSGTSIIRAIATKKSSVTDSISDSPVATATYLFIENIIRQPNNPSSYPTSWGKYALITGTAVADYEMDPELMAETAYAEKVKTALKDLPVVSLVTDKNNLFSQVNDTATGGIYIFTGPPTGGPGAGWERPASVEYFDEKDTLTFQVNCALQLHGGHSRLPEKCPKHSFRIDFQEEYGVTKLRYAIFGKNEPDKYNSLILRAGFGNSWVHQTEAERSIAIYSRDEWSKKTQKNMGNLSTNFRYVHLFINGMYWGLYNILERVDDDFCNTYLPGKKENFDVIKVEDSPQTVIASDGTLDAWKSLQTLSDSAANPVFYQRILGNTPNGLPDPNILPLLDVENFIDYMLINFYGGNTDWDNHNWIAVRNRVTPDKGFKFICWDSEHILKTLDMNVLTEKNLQCPSYIFQQLRKNPLFLRLFFDRVQKHCYNGGNLTASVATKTWIDLANQIDNSIYAESARWGDYRRDVHPYTTQGQLYRKDVHYEAQKKFMLESYFPGRTNNLIKQLKAAGLFPSVEAPVFAINGNPAHVDTIREGQILSMSTPQGYIYYTTDESDPVVWAANGTGVKSATAISYSKSWSPAQSLTVKARALYNGTWSAMNVNSYFLMKTSALDETDEISKKIILRSYPNPLKDQSAIQYSVPSDGNVEIEIFDIAGRKISTVVNGFVQAGNHEITWDASTLNEGVYICKLTIQGEINQQTMIKMIK